MVLQMTTKSVFLLPDNRKFKLSDAVLKKMFSYAQDLNKSPESGGIMIGRILCQEDHIIVDEISEPLSSDIQSRRRFIRKSVGHQEFFNRHWKLSQGRCFYLGEWHTHPEKQPVPSSVDLREWRKLICKSVQQQAQLFFVIVGTQELVVYMGDATIKEIIKLGSYQRNSIKIGN